MGCFVFSLRSPAAESNASEACFYVQVFLKLAFNNIARQLSVHRGKATLRMQATAIASRMSALELQLLWASCECEQNKKTGIPATCLHSIFPTSLLLPTSYFLLPTSYLLLPTSYLLLPFKGSRK